MGDRKKGFGDYDTPAKLKSLLNKLLDERQLPTARNRIDRGNIEKKFGFTGSSLTNFHGIEKYEWSKQVVDDFEAKLIKEEGGNISGVNLDYGTPVRLQKLLAELAETLDIGLARSGARAGHISLSTFQTKYGFPSGSLTVGSVNWAWARDMIAKLDAELYEKGLIGTVWERKVPKIRKYLEELVKKGTLPVNEHGGLNRMFVMREFGLPENQSTNVSEARAPKLKELFAEYDKIVINSGYTQYGGDAYLDKLKSLLESAELVLDKNRQNISRKWLSKELGFSAEMFRKTPSLLALIKKKEKGIAAKLRRGKTKKSFSIYGAASMNLGASPYSDKHNRVFTFEELIPLYSLEFAEKIGTLFIAISNNIKSCNPYYARTLHFLKWLADKANGAEDIVVALTANTVIDIKSFSRVCMEYQQCLVDLCSGKTVKHNLIVITKFGELKAFPEHVFSQKSRYYGKDSANRKSILEADKKDVRGSITEILNEAKKYRNIEIGDGKDTKAFVATLTEEKERRDDLPDDLAEAMLLITKDRLDEMRKQASKVFKNWRQMHEQGRSLIDRATINAKDASNFIDGPTNRNSKRWRHFVKTTFPRDRPDEALCNLLSIIEYRNNGIPPIDKQFWSKQYGKVGGIDKVISHLMPTRRAVSAAITLYLCESGVNSEVALSLSPDCISDSDVPGHKRIVSHKGRSKGKAIYDDLLTKSKDKEVISAIAAIGYLIDITRKQSIKQDKAGGMTIYAESGKIKTLSEYNLRMDFKEICNNSDYLVDYNFTPSMLRPTVLLEIQLKDPTNLGVAQMMAKHESPTTTDGYTNKLPHRLKREEHMLEYQCSIEFVLSDKVENPHIKIGVTEGEWGQRMEHAEKTGMGVFCADRTIVDEKGNESKCFSVDSCVTCKHGRMLVSADVQSISEMIVWNKSLEMHEEKWVAERFKRWNDIWVPWQAFFCVVLDEKMTRGKLSKIKKDANVFAEQIMKQDGFVMPEPW